MCVTFDCTWVQLSTGLYKRWSYTLQGSCLAIVSWASQHLCFNPHCQTSTSMCERERQRWSDLNPGCLASCQRKQYFNDPATCGAWGDELMAKHICHCWESVRSATQKNRILDKKNMINHGFRSSLLFFSAWVSYETSVWEGFDFKTKWLNKKHMNLPSPVRPFTHTSRKNSWKQNHRDQCVLQQITPEISLSLVVFKSFRLLKK